MQLIGIDLLFWVGLSGSEDIIGKKCALTTLGVRQGSGLCQMRCSIEGNQGGRADEFLAFTSSCVVLLFEKYFFLSPHPSNPD